MFELSLSCTPADASSMAEASTKANASTMADASDNNSVTRIAGQVIDNLRTLHAPC